MKDVHLITVGKLKDPKLESIEKDYLKRLQSIKLKIVETKARGDKVEEAREILKKIKEISKDQGAYIILLTENGKMHDSNNFSNWLFDILAKKQDKIFLVIGGASGFSDTILEEADDQLSLSKLTFPHKIARILLVEQIYRAQTIHGGHPYHK